MDFYAKYYPNNSVALQINKTFSFDKFLFSSSYFKIPLILDTENASSNFEIIILIYLLEKFIKTELFYQFLTLSN